ncbi:hypothetical protein ABQE62_11170 [Mycolicibacterium fortuitum]
MDDKRDVYDAENHRSKGEEYQDDEERDRECALRPTSLARSVAVLRVSRHRGGTVSQRRRLEAAQLRVEDAVHRLAAPTPSGVLLR